MKIKLCGFSNKETVDLAVRCKADFIGFVFYALSRRYVTPKKSAEISIDIPENIKKVAVLVDPENEEIDQIIEHLNPDLLQLHQTSLERCQEIKSNYQIPIVKAFAVTSKKDLRDLNEYEQIADYFLFDAKNKEVGGAGRIFDWRVLDDLKTDKEWFLSGGLNMNNIKEALKVTKAQMVDLSSGIEKEKGVKSPEMIVNFMSRAGKLVT
ncbi:MAG: phosphoribosylanthranilate isomerase [Lentimonas sp.]|jgi:phosphoribosylanthranilate isomerase